jgi:septum formation protein
MLVLASASPRRQELLRNAGISFVVQASKIPEVPAQGEQPRAFAERMAREKARAVSLQHPCDVVLGADTVVIIEGQILGKPRDDADAARMLRLLSGRSHEVITGVCLARAENNQKAETRFEDVRSEITRVTMNILSDEDIRSYVATGEPADKAGAYAIQGRASRWISRIEGDYFNVVGLPVALVCEMLREQGVI